MRLNEDQSLSLACAIDVGIVLTVAEPIDIVSNLEAQFRPARVVGSESRPSSSGATAPSG